MSVDVAARLIALARKDADLLEQHASAQDILVETAIDAGHLHALIEAMWTEREA